MNTGLQRLLLTATCFAAGWLGTSAFWKEPPPGVTDRTIPLAAATAATSAPSASRLDALFATVSRASGPGAQVRAALELAAALEPGEFETAMSRALELPANSAMTLFTSAAVLRWTAADPAAAARWCSGNAGNLVHDVVRLWTERDPGAARAFMDSLAGEKGRSARAGYAEALADTDPSAALEFLRRESRDGEPRAALARLAQRDPAWLLENAEALPASRRSDARGAAVRVMAQRDFAGALAWSAQQPDREALVQGLMKNAASTEQALAAFHSMPGAWREAKVWELGSFLERQDDALAALRDAPGLTPEMRGHLLNSVGYAAARSDPAGTAARLQEWFPEQASSWAGRAASAWHEQDPAAARAWVERLPEPARTAAQKGLEQAEKLAAPAAAATPLERLQAKAAAGIYSGSEDALNLSPEERARFLSQSAQGELPQASTVIRAIQSEWPEDYARWIAAQPAEESTRDKLPEFAGTWAGEEPDAAAAWVQSLPAGEVRSAAAAQVAGQWSALDPGAAQRWVDSLPAGGDREAAQAALAAQAGP